MARRAAHRGVHAGEPRTEGVYDRGIRPRAPPSATRRRSPAISTTHLTRSGEILGTLDVDHSDAAYRAWLKEAVRKVQADANRSADTHLLRFPLPERWGIDLYLKDESTHPTGSLKHRLARSLFLYGLCNGWIRPGRPVIEASSGSTAVSEAYFAKLIGVPFIAVMPRTTSAEKMPPDRVPRRPVPLRGRLTEDVRGVGRPRGRDRRPLHGPVHLRRTGHGLARQQQHRRIHLPPAGAGAFPRARLDRRHGRHRRHLGDPRPLRALHAVRHPHLRRRPGELLFLRGLDHRRPWRHLRLRLPYRGHRPPPHGAQLRARRHRPDDEGPGRGERGGRTGPGGRPSAARRAAPRAPACGAR